MESNKIIPKGLLFPFILLTTLFFAWAVPNNLTDTMLAAFKRIMSMSDSKNSLDTGRMLFIGIWMLCCSWCFIYQEVYL